MFKVKLASTVMLATCLLNACMVGPTYTPPATNIAATWHTKDTGITIPSTPTTITWWETFHDPVLTRLIKLGHANNLNVQSAGVKVLQARAQLAQSVGELYPQQQAISANDTRQRIGGSSQYTNLSSKILETDAVSLGASWEPDFWGQYRHAIRANDANFLASLAAYDNMLVILTADIGSNYISIRTSQAQIATTKNSITLLKQNLRLTQTRYHLGQVDLSAVEQMISTLDQAEATLPTLYASLQQQKDALAVLLGTTSDKINALLQAPSGKKSTIPKAPTTIAISIPNDILRQRPDVHQAELQAIAQCEEIGAIKAQLYPAFTLSGSLGYAASNAGGSSPSNLFQWSNRVYSLGPSLNIPIFNYGQITNQVRQQDAVFQQSIFNYQNIVLNAQKEVQDGIASYIESAKTLKSMTAANHAALTTVQLMRVRYEAGQVGYSEVLNAETSQLAVQSTLLNAEGNEPQAAVSLYRALGGGWQVRMGHDIISTPVKKEMEQRTNWGDLLHAENHVAATSKGQEYKQTWQPDW